MASFIVLFQPCTMPSLTVFQPVLKTNAYLELLLGALSTYWHTGLLWSRYHCQGTDFDIHLKILPISRTVCQQKKSKSYEPQMLQKTDWQLLCTRYSCLPEQGRLNILEVKHASVGHSVGWVGLRRSAYSRGLQANSWNPQMARQESNVKSPRAWAITE